MSLSNDAFGGDFCFVLYEGRTAPPTAQYIIEPLCPARVLRPMVCTYLVFIFNHMANIVPSISLRSTTNPKLCHLDETRPHQVRFG